MKDRISDIKQVSGKPKSLLTICEDAPIKDAAEEMKKNKIGCLIVLNNKNDFVGIITERDILYKTILSDKSINHILVKDIMTKDTITCSMNDPIEKVENLMTKHNIRHTPVLTDKTPIAMVSIRDTIAYRLQINKSMKLAAEELAMLSTGLKSLDFDDVIDLAINEIPKNFKAKNSVLFLKNTKSYDEESVYRNNCPIPEIDLAEPEKLNKIAESKNIISYKRLCDECSHVKNSNTAITIPITVFGHSTKKDCNHTSMQGFLCMCNFKSSPNNTEDLRQYKATLVKDLINANLTNAKLYHDFQMALQKSQTDPLTGVGTRNILDQTLEIECERSRRYNTVFSVAIIDLDHFKQINDTSGHSAGDKALKKIAKLITKSMRTTDVIARYGGDEFILIMPETKDKDAMRLIERLRRQAKTVFINEKQNITVSCGITQSSSDNFETPSSILERADAALYEAKEMGRDKVVMKKHNDDIAKLLF